MGILGTLRQDIEVTLERDPAAHNVVEIVLAYPGVHAIWFYRLTHALWEAGFPVVPRVISHLARFLTGIEIHPGAKLGPGLFIDHGMGVVIGETAEVGNNVTLYQGVTLGAQTLHTGKRHPTLGDNVVVGAGAKVLGPVTVGEECVIGAGAVVLNDVPSHATVVGVPGHVVAMRDPQTGESARVVQPDPMAEALYALQKRVVSLEARLARYEKEESSVDREESLESCRDG
jgi:serine O-acetyltransferase